MADKNISVGIVVATFNRKDLLRQNLQWLESQTRPAEEIIVVDNGSQDGSLSMVKTEFPGVTLASLQENLGISGAAAAGTRMAYENGHDWVWIMDDDAFPKEDALENLCRVLEEKPCDSFCLYSCHVDPEEKYFTEPVACLENGRMSFLTDFQETRHAFTLFESTGGPFLGFMVPREAIRRVGVPHPDTFIWGDFEYLGRLRQNGFKVFYCTQSIIHHPRPEWYEISVPTGLFSRKRSLWKTYSFPKAASWKYYYGIRNSLYTALPYNREFHPKLFVKVIALQLLRIFTLLRFEKRKGIVLKYCGWALWDGIRGKLGKRIDPQKLPSSQ